MKKALAPGAAFITFLIKPAEKANQTQATEKRGQLLEPPSAPVSFSMGFSIGQQWGRADGPCFCLHDGHSTSQLSTKIKESWALPSFQWGGSGLSAKAGGQQVTL